MATNALNRLEPVYYRVTVTGLDIDPVSPENFTTLPTTNVASLLIERANMRWEAAVRGASETISPLFTPAFVSANRTADIPEDDLVFTLTYDRPEYLDTEDETAAPARLTGADAVKRFIARALVPEEITNRNVFQPEPPAAALVPFNGTQILEVTAPSLGDLATVEAGLAVVEIVNLDDKP